MSKLYDPPPIGSFRKRITLETPLKTPTVAGETVGTQVPVKFAWASLEPLSGRELALMGFQQQTNMFRIRMLYQPGITADMRATLGSRVFAFTSVNDPGELHRELEILATEVIST